MTSLLLFLIQPALACTHTGPCDHDVEALVDIQIAVFEDEVEEDIEDVEDVEDVEQDVADDCYEDRCSDRQRKEHDKGFTALRVDGMGLRQHSAWGVSLRSMGKRDGWIVVEGRWANDDAWMGRAGLGFDFFGRSPIDLGLGLVAGHIGDWQTDENRRFSIGTELLVGWRPGRFILEHRHMGGPTPSGGIRTEGQTRLGYRPMDRLEVYLNWATIDPTNQVAEHGFGAGVGWRF